MLPGEVPRRKGSKLQVGSASDGDIKLIIDTCIDSAL